MVCPRLCHGDMLNVKNISCTAGRPANPVDRIHSTVLCISNLITACAYPMHVISLITPSLINPTPNKFPEVQAHQAITLHTMCQKMVPLIALSL